MNTHVTMTADNFKDIVEGLKHNQISALAVDIKEWLSHYSPAQRVISLQTLADACRENTSLKEMKMTHFDFKQSEESGPVEPQMMAKIVGMIANSCQNLAKIDLLQCNLKGCDALMKAEVLGRYKSSRDNFQIFCNGIPSYQAQPMANGAVIFSTITTRQAFDFFKERHKTSREAIAGSDEPTPTPGKNQLP